MAKIHPTIIGIAHAACDGLMTGWCIFHQIVGKSPAVNSIAQVKKTRSRLTQPNVLRTRKRTTKSGKTIKAVTISIRTSHCNRAPQFIDVIIASIGKIALHGMHQVKAVPATAKPISVRCSLNPLEAPTRIATRT